MKKDTTTPPIAAVDVPPDLKRLHELCRLNATANRELALEKARIEHEFNALVSRHAEYVVEQQAAAERTLAGIEDLVRQHPEWLGEKRQLKTPHGTIKLTATSSLSIADEADTLNRLFARGKRDSGFNAELYYSEKLTLDKEALEKLSNANLGRLGIVRVEGDSFSFKLTAVDINKALLDSVPPQQAAA